MNILLINNHTKHLGKLVNLLSDHNLDIISREDLRNFDYKKHDLIILSGGSHVCPAQSHDYDTEVEIILNSKQAIIGICLGCEIIAVAFGCLIKRLPKKEKGIRKINFFNKTFEVYEAHKFAIDNISKKIQVLASSENGPEIIKHKDKQIFGLQFHPEMLTNENDGKQIFESILKIMKMD